MSRSLHARTPTRRLALTTLLAATAIACGGGASHGRTVTVSVAPDTSCLLPAGTVQLTAVARDAGGAPTGQPVTWASDAPLVATVDGNGLVTAVGPGTAGITATAGGTASPAATMAVHPRPVGLIAYSALDSGSGKYRVHTVNLDGTDDVDLTEGFQPRLSPDGTLIAFLRGGGDVGPGDSLYDLDLTGNRMPAQVTLYANTTDYIHTYGWSGDSTQVVYDWQNGIYRVGGSGGASTTIVAVSANDDCPDVNPVDGRIAFHDYLQSLFVMDAGGAGRSAVPNTAAGDLLPRWSPDGAWLSYFHPDGASHQSAPYKIRADGTGLTPLVTFPVDAHNHAAGAAFPWTSDGAWVVGLLVRGDASAQATGIWAVASDGSGCMLPVPAAQAASADYVGSVR